MLASSLTTFPEESALLFRGTSRHETNRLHKNSSERAKEGLMRVVGILTMVLITYLAGGCLGPDPAKKAAMDQRVAQIQMSKAEYGAPRPVMLQPKVGQWAQYKQTTRSGVGFLTVKLVAQERGAYWIEEVIEDYDGRAFIKLLADFGDLKDPHTQKVLAMKMKDTQGRITEFPPEFIKSAQTLGNTMFSVKPWSELPQEAMQVPAGHFAKCYRANIDAVIISTVWYHSAVPTGIVKSVSEGLFGQTMELVAFGDTGATSEF
jgi:hypothetical protein